MELAEKHSRIRAVVDETARIEYHRFVVANFGGDYQRAAWFADECRVLAANAYKELDDEHTTV